MKLATDKGTIRLPVSDITRPSRREIPELDSRRSEWCSDCTSLKRRLCMKNKNAFDMEVVHAKRKGYYQRQVPLDLVAFSISRTDIPRAQCW